MRSFYRFFRGLHRWLIANVCVLALYFLLRPQRGVMNWWTQRVALPLERALAALCALVPTSVAEWFYVAAALALLAWLAAFAVALLRAPYKRDVVYGRTLGLVNAALTVYALFCLLWGTVCYADDFCDKSGLSPQPVAYEDLLRVTEYFARQTALTAGDVPRDDAGRFAVPVSDILAFAPTLYEETLYADYPFLRIPRDRAPKRVLFSRVMSLTNFTGFYFPFTGECNVNTDFPAADLPSTAAHELAHRRGIASEQQCNFLAVLSSTRSSNTAYRYSGWLMGYVHLSNALYSVDPDAWLAIRLALPAEVEADLRASSEYWAQYEGPVAEASDRVYDAMLKSYGQELGVRSYGAVVDLLVAYYK